VGLGEVEVTGEVVLFPPMEEVTPRGSKHMSTTAVIPSSAPPSTEASLVAKLLAELERVLGWLKPYFRRSQTRSNVEDFLRALLARVEHKNSWGLSEEAGRTTPYAFQYLLGRARWEPDEVRDAVQADVLRKLGPRGDIILDETGFLKKGDMSAGVAWQYTGTAGGVANCQVGVFLVYATPQGYTLLDRELYLPEEWMQERERCRRAGIPEEVDFATKPVLAQRMLQRAFEAGYTPRWVLGDEVYGRDGRLRDLLEQRHQRYALTVASNTPVERGLRKTTPLQLLLEEMRPEDFHRLSAGEGTKGPRESDWARVRLNPGVKSLSRWLLVRRKVGKPLEELTLSDYDFFLIHAPANTSLEAMVEAAGGRWPVELCFESARQEVGLDDYQVRSWTGWYRHMTLSLVAHTFLATARLELNALEEAACAGPLHSPGPTADTREQSHAPPSNSLAVGGPEHQGLGNKRASPEPLLPKALGPSRKRGSGMLPFLRRRGLHSSALASNSSASVFRK
jgi:SRSO17 transposase